MFLDDKPHFFGRRKGRRIRKAKTALLEDFLPRWRLIRKIRSPLASSLKKFV